MSGRDGPQPLLAIRDLHVTVAGRRAAQPVLRGVSLAREPHVEFKRRVPGAIGLIRTGETVPYANLILISG